MINMMIYLLKMVVSQFAMFNNQRVYCNYNLVLYYSRHVVIKYTLDMLIKYYKYI